MKKLFLLGCSILSILCFTGCQVNDSIDVYTTVYPIEYLVETLYGAHASVSSIYPNGSDITNYELTDKLRDTYSKGALFVYNGITDEKMIAKSLVNKRKGLKIIDASYGLKANNGMEELWLSPSNYLMLATNLKDGLEDQLGTKYLNEEIEGHFHDLEEKLSVMDADMRITAKSAANRNKKTIVASSNVFKFLEDYGFTVISLEDYEENSPNYESLKSHFRSGTYKYILTKNTDPENAKAIDFKNTSNATLVPVNMMHTLTEEDVTNKNSYFTIMNDFLSNLKQVTDY